MNERVRAEKAGRDTLVRLRRLTKTYREGERERVVLRGVDAEIERGAFVALVGRSGSGKSTLLNLISGIDRPTGGEVIVGGTNLTRLSEEERTRFRRLHIGFVFQSFNLIPTLTVAENVLLPLELGGRTSAAERDKALAFLDEVGLGDRQGSFPDRLSGGEQQRVAIARALAHDPLLVLADEPTGNLDYDTGRQVMEMLHRLVRKAGTTMLVVTHDRDFLDASDRVFTLRRGVLEAGAPAYLRA
ncbi:ABC transporter ATP-binding protein [Rhodocaloribacter sp.]